jgi:glutamate synthase (NADPH/NADH) small chain
MANPRGFLEVHRAPAPERPPQERVRDYAEIYGTLPEDELRHQASRCMDCGVPFCNNACPLGNLIPDWNDLARVGDWHRAIDQLHATNNFPEFTGLICPAPCEAACVLDIDDDPVMIKQIEYWTINHAFEQGWVVPEPPKTRTGRHVAVVGSGPAGMAAAAELNKVGHRVTVYERDEAPGGMMRFGVPDAKLEKWMIDRRIAILEQEGIEFRYNVEVGRDLSVERLRTEHDAVVLAIGSRVERDLDVPGRDLDGVHFAMEFLPQQNKVVAGDSVANQIKATGKRVVIIGGGDTGSDCVGTSIRHGAASITQFELLPQPPESENKPLVWPNWPIKLRTSSSHEEGCDRDWSVTTKRFEGRDGKVEKLVAARVEWHRDGNAPPKMVEIPGSEFEIPADLVLFAMGFVGPVQTGLLAQFGVERDARTNVKADTDTYRTSVPKVFAAGDMRRGQSLVVWAIREGRQAARAVDEFLMGSSTLPR